MRQQTVHGLSRDEMEVVLAAARDAVHPTSRFRLFGVTQRDIDRAHAETRALFLARYQA